MARQSLIWTALPNGYTPDRTGLRMSVMLSPRLDPQHPPGKPEKLSAFFPDWEDWPKSVATARFDITYNGQTVSVPATTVTGADRVDTRLGAADSAVWKALFNPTLSVKGFKYVDRSPSVMVSYDSVGMAETIENLYRDLARTAGDRMPRVTGLLETERWYGFVQAVRRLDADSVDRHTGLRDTQKQFDALRRGGRTSISTLERFQLFHTPPAAPKVRRARPIDDDRIETRWREHERVELPEREDIAETIDFHQVVAAMGSYPTLLRRLGLVVDFVLAPAGFTPSAAADLSVKVVFPGGALQVPRTSDGNPVTRTRLNVSRFDAVPDPSLTPMKNGLLELAPARFRLLQFDVDGAGLKLMNFARSLGRREQPESRVDPVTRHEDEVGASSLRTAGLMLVQRERAKTLSTRFDNNKADNAKLESQLAGAASAVTLPAQHLVRGYRIDIWDSVTGRWNSLCRRTASYRLADGAVIVDVTPEEECTVQLAATRSADPTSNADLLYLHEALVSWTGWSLAAPSPGRAIGLKDEVDETRDDSAAEIPPGLKFESSFSPVKGSLPRLRFGRSYWIRARVVDLAGNSLEPQAKDYDNEQPLTHALPYLRYEPVAAPVIALLSTSGLIERPSEGESMARVAIRSFNDEPDDNVVPTSQVAHRVAAPPQVSVRDAEHHGKLDKLGKLDASLFNLLAHQKDVDPRDPSAAVRQEKLLMQGPLDAHAVETTFAVYEYGRALTYLPDPLATEVAVRVFDHPNIADSEIIRIPLYATSDWPEAKPFVIDVYDDPNESPYYDSVTHRLHVPLPKAVRARLRLSMTLSPEALPLLGVFQMLSATDQAAQRDRALKGQHWMLTPWTVVEVVHAVQRPLINPDFVTLSIWERSPGQTSAQPSIHVRCSIDSTDRLDLYGEWHEPDDDPANSESATAPSDRQRRDVAFQVKVTSPKHYAADSVAPGWPEHSIPVPDVVAINNADGHRRIVTKSHEFHDTRYRRIEYWFDATTRFREFLPPPLLAALVDGKPVPTEANIKITGARQVTWVPNSAPPPAPKVLYVVPTFGWQREVDDQGGLSSWRRGGGLRVYLDRGWNASGYGEMLAVVLPPKGFTGNPDEVPKGAPYKKYLTLWGNDPIWASAFVAGVAPTLAHFPLARVAPDPTGGWLPPNAPPSEKDQRPGPFVVSSLRPPGLPASGGQVDIAPHDVFYDEARQLWYCDVEIATGASYFPFVRLALARYQPISSLNAHLSNVILSDIIAVAPDRWMNVTPATDSRRVRVAVFGAGIDGSSGHREASQAPTAIRLNPLTEMVELVTPAAISDRTVVEVWLEKLDPRWGEDFGWQRVSDVLVTQRIPAPELSTVPAVTLESVFGRAVTSTDRMEQSPRSAELADVRLAPSHVIDKIRLWRTLWEGDVTLPPADDSRYRLVVTESEEYLVDDDRPYDKTPTRKARRVVFIENVELA